MSLQEGLLSVLFLIVSYMILPDTPEAVQSLTVDEKELVSRVLLDDAIVKMKERSSSRSWAELRRTFTQPHILMLGVAGIFNGMFIPTRYRMKPPFDVGLPSGTTVASLS